MAKTYVVARLRELNDAMDAERAGPRELERRSGVNKSSISDYATKPGVSVERGNAQKIADALNRPIQALFVHRDGAELA